MNGKMLGFPKSTSQVWVHTFNTRGSTNTAVIRFSTIQELIGDDINYRDSVINGGTFIIKRPGVYACSVWSYEDDTGTLEGVGIVVNPAAAVTALTAGGGKEFIGGNAPQVGSSQAIFASSSATKFFNAGDIIYFTNTGSPSANQTRCGAIIVRVL